MWTLTQETKFSIFHYLSLLFTLELLLSTSVVEFSCQTRSIVQQLGICKCVYPVRHILPQTLFPYKWNLLNKYHPMKGHNILNNNNNAEIELLSQNQHHQRLFLLQFRGFGLLFILLISGEQCLEQWPSWGSDQVTLIRFAYRTVGYSEQHQQLPLPHPIQTSPPPPEISSSLYLTNAICKV